MGEVAESRWWDKESGVFIRFSEDSRVEPIVRPLLTLDKARFRCKKNLHLPMLY